MVHGTHKMKCALICFFSRSDRSAASISLTTYQRRAALAGIYSFGCDIELKGRHVDTMYDFTQDQSLEANV